MKKFFKTTLIICVTLLLFAVTSFSAENSLEENKEIAKTLESDLEKIQDSLSDVKRDLEKAQKEQKSQLYIKSQLDQEISLMTSQISTRESLVVEYNKQIDELNLEIDALNEDIEESYNILKERLILSHENGNDDVIGFILGSGDFSDLLTRIDITNELFEYDKKLLAGLENDKSVVESKKAEIEIARNKCQEQIDTMAVEKVELDQKYAVADNYLKELEKDESALLKKIQESEAEMNAIEREMKEILSKIEAQERTNYYATSEFIFPLYAKDYTYCSGGFGWRVWNNGRTTDFHRGMDFPAPRGTHIIASNSGTVIISKVSPSYGEYVSIDHGGGCTTLYAHCSKRLVNVGDKVEKGQVIAYVGSTGDSTGNHLHFSVFLNGEAVDPLGYISLPKK